MSLWLDPDELYELTGYRRRREVLAGLVRLGVKFRTRPADGYPLVLRADFEQRSTGAPRKRGPDWQAAEKTA